MDIKEKLNEIKLQLQGRDEELADMISDIKAFIKKLEYSIRKILLEPNDSKYHIEIE